MIHKSLYVGPIRADAIRAEKEDVAVAAPDSTRLTRAQMQSRDPLEVPGVQRGDGVALLNRGRADQQVISRERDAFGGLFSTYLAGNFRGAVSDRMHGDMLLHFIDERSTRDSDLRCVGADRTMNEFSRGDCRDRDLDFSEGPPNRREQLFDRLPFPFCGDDYAGIED